MADNLNSDIHFMGFVEFFDALAYASIEKSTIDRLDNIQILLAQYFGLKLDTGIISQEAFDILVGIFEFISNLIVFFFAMYLAHTFI